MSNSIYDITERFQQVVDLLESGEYDREALENTLELIQCEIEEKADGYARIIKNFESYVTGIKAEEERLSKKRKAIENNIKGLKENLTFAMKATGKVKFKTELFSFTVQKNPPKVVVDDERKIPKDFLIPQPDKVDTAEIKKILKEGAELDFAHLEQGEGVRIR